MSNHDLNICYSGHDQICYTGNTCPACALLDEIGELKDQVKDLESNLESKSQG